MRVVCFRNPKEGSVVFDETKFVVASKFLTAKLDDLIIRRTDGALLLTTFVVVVMTAYGYYTRSRWRPHQQHNSSNQHLRSTRRQFQLSLTRQMILGDDGAKRLSATSRRCISNGQYIEGYSPNALNNYLVRLGWSHGDQEIFLSRRDDWILQPERNQQVCISIQHWKATLVEQPLHQDLSLSTLQSTYTGTLDAQKIRYNKWPSDHWSVDQASWRAL